jgi:hypothetical protein
MYPLLHKGPKNLFHHFVEKRSKCGPSMSTKIMAPITVLSWPPNVY